MFAVFCRRRPSVPPTFCIFVGRQVSAPENVVLVRSFSSSVCKNVSEKSFTVSYLINSCGLSSTDAISASNKMSIKSPEKTDAVLELLRKYGFTNADISRLVTKHPDVLLAGPNNNLLPKLDFFLSIGVPLPVLVKSISLQPLVFRRGLENSIIPTYDCLKTLLQSDERVVHVFSRAPRTFGCGWPVGISAIISMFRERGVPEPSIVKMVMHRPSLLVTSREKVAAYVDRAVEMGFDISRSAFIYAVRVFAELCESNLKNKMEVYRRCGWSESDINAAFLRSPNCMSLSEKKIMANMDFLVNTQGYKPNAVAQRPGLLNLSLEKRIKPRCLVAGILEQKGLFKKTTPGMTTLLKMSEKEFLKSYVVKYEKDIPELSDVYRGKLSSPRPLETDIGRCM
ncbi:hypothetical protein OROHE_025731 [Orobanche hederae]